MNPQDLNSFARAPYGTTSTGEPQHPARKVVTFLLVVAVFIGGYYFYTHRKSVTSEGTVDQQKVNVLNGLSQDTTAASQTTVVNDLGPDAPIKKPVKGKPAPVPKQTAPIDDVSRKDVLNGLN